MDLVGGVTETYRSPTPAWHKLVVVNTETDRRTS